MYARLMLATLISLVWAASGHAQFHERDRFPERDRFREHDWGRKSIPPIRSHPVELVKPVHETDWQICGNTETAPDAVIAACGRIIARKQQRNGPDLAVAYTHRGQAFQGLGDYAHAVSDFSEAIRLKPDVSGYFAMRGDAWEKSGDPRAALIDFRKAASLDADNQDALNSIKRVESRSVASTDSTGVPSRTAAPTQTPPAVVAQAPAPIVTQTPPAIVPHAPAPIVTQTSPAIIPLAPLAVVAQTPPAIIARAPPAIVVQAPPAVVAQAPPAIVGQTPPVIAPQATPGNTTQAAAVVAALSSSAAIREPPAAPPPQGSRIALVIGNGAYVNANVLPNPPNDARAIAAALREIGFDVVEGTDLDRATMEKDLQEFLHKAANASIVLLFYAGHGMQVDGKNYLVPVDAKLAEASDLDFETIEIDKVLDALGDPGHTNIILLDACRDNPLARSFARRLSSTRSAAVASGLAPYSAVGTGTLIAYATAPGQTALDGQGKDSPFTTSLLHYIRTPGLEIRQVLTRVRAEVAAETDNRQIPWDNSSLMGDVVLVK